MRNEVAAVKEKIDIVTIIGEHIALKKAGRHWKGLCPFHNEKTPSFTVSPELQMYKCFGCGESGDVFTFLEKYEGLEFPDVLKILAERAGITLTPFKGEESSHKDILYEANEASAKYYHYILKNLESGADYLSYLTKTRALTLETIDTFVIGAAPDGSARSLFEFLTKKKGYKPEVVLEAGLVYKTDRGAYVDRFRGRVMFPIQNARGATIALAGRVLPTLPQAKKLAKYINSPETPIYHKSESLFGIAQAREAIKRSGIAIVVEGELDMIIPWQAGVKNIVAIKGSALTEHHAQVLSRLAKTVVLALDSDFAGNTAAIKGIALAQNAGLQVKVATLSEFKDPDEFVRHDLPGFKKALDAAQDVWDFIIDVYFERYDATTASGKSSISKELIPHLTLITDSILKAHYTRLIANRLSVPEEAVKSALDSQAKKQTAPKVVAVKEPVTEAKKTQEEVDDERFFIVGCRLNPQLLIDDSVLGGISSVRVKRLIEFLAEYLKDNTFLLQHFVKEIPQELQDWFVQSYVVEEFDDGNSEVEFHDLKKKIKLRVKMKERDIADRDIDKFDKEGDAERLKVAQAKKMAIQSEIEKIKKS